MDQFLLSSDTLANVNMDNWFFSSGFTGERLGKKLYDSSSVPEFFSADWIKQSVLTLLGFATYQIFVRKMIANTYEDQYVRMAVDDILKVGVMLITREILMAGSLNVVLNPNEPSAYYNNNGWMFGSAAILTGFVSYDLVVARFINLDSYQSPENRNSVRDVAKFGTMFIVSEFLNALKNGNVAQRFTSELYQWGIPSVGFLAGITLYNQFIGARL